jgi:predicted O-linked N-acetylglucosamine transferase (SPINDLY family)
VGLFERFRTIKFAERNPSAVVEANASDLVAQGNALEDAGQLPQALQRYEEAITLAPQFARAHLNRGNALLASDEVAAAIEAFETALQHDPDYAAAHFNLGNAYVRAGRADAAMKAYGKAIALKPDFVDAHVALGAVLDDSRHCGAAIAHYRHALAIRPGYAEVHNNLGKSLREMGQFEDALASYRQALEINPDYAEGHNNLGNVLKDLGRLDEALAHYRRALELAPAFVEAHSNLLFLLNYRADADARLALSEARRYGTWVTEHAHIYAEWANLREPERCLRIGFMSGDLRNHPVSYFFEGVLSALTRLTPHRLEFFCYSNHFLVDSVTERIRSWCDGWCRTVGMSDAAVADRIRGDAIDILIDLSGHTAHNRLPVFAWKPAPVQISWLGYFGTTGVGAMDYLIADPWTLPPSEEANFTEKIWRLPETRLCFTPPDVAVQVSPLPALGNGYLTFGCFNNLSKMNERVVAVWAQVLHATAGSRLFLKSPQLKEAVVRNGVCEAFAAHGIEPERLMLEGLSSRADYLACYHRVDIALDPFPYTGGTTTAEALWMGVPVLTLKGERFLSRQGVGLLMNAGLPDWIAADPADYVLRATAHARDVHALAKLRATLRQQVLASPLFNASDFARHFETALRGMWRTWCSQQAVR